MSLPPDPAAVRLIIDGVPRLVTPGISLLAALTDAGVELPALCHDPRLKPSGMCRLCSVEVAGSDRVLVACATPVADGMVVTTRSPALEAFRRTQLEMLAPRASAASRALLPEKPFHQVLERLGIPPPEEPAPTGIAVDESHPYIRVDMSQCIQCYRCVRICDEVQGLSVWHVLGRAPEGHIVPDSLTSLAESSCTGCGACVDTCPTGALVDKQRLALGAADSWTRSVCGYCGVGCEIHVGARAGRVVQIRPVVESPVNKGHLCIKGRYAIEFNDAPSRQGQALLRRGGKWLPVAWDTALEAVASELSRIRDRYGPAAIGMLGSARATNEDNYVTQKFARTVLGTNNVDCCARVCHTPSAAALKGMLGQGAATNSFADIELAGAFLLVGCNPAENHPIVGARILQRVRAGVPLVLVDPRATPLAAHATLHLRPRPGTNVPLLNALAHVIVAEGLADESFLARRVAGLERYTTLVSAWTPERAASLCDVHPEQIREAARLYATTRPAMCFHGLGVTEHLQGTEAVRCLINLALLTGNLGKAGAGVNPLRGQNNVQGAAQMGCDPGNLTGGAGLDEARGRFASLWQQDLPTEPGLTLPHMLDAAAAGTLKALWVVGYDVLLTYAGLATTRAALSQLECVIVQDLFLNETARECGTVFLPAASVFERDGTFMNSERRIQRVRAAVPPPGEARPDWQIISAVARRMGYGAGFGWDGPAAIWDEVRAAWPAAAGISYARLQGPGRQWPCADESQSGDDVLYSDSFTIGARATLACVDYLPTTERVTPDFPLLLTTGRTLYQFNAGTMTGWGGTRALRPTDCVDINPLVAKAAGITSGDQVLMESRHGQVRLVTRVSNTVRPGEVFATFHDPATGLNLVTSGHRDRVTGAPEYKVTAVRVSVAPSPPVTTSRQRGSSAPE